MDYVIAVFINRAQSQMFSKILFRYRVNNQIVSTPRELGVSCGLSVKFNIVNLKQAKIALNSGSYSSFKNFYKIVPLSSNKYTYIKV